MTLEDTSPMPFGKYQDTPMQDVPPDYLLWMADKIEKDKWDAPAAQAVAEYVNNYREVLEQEVEDDES